MLLGRVAWVIEGKGLLLTTGKHRKQTTISSRYRNRKDQKDKPQKAASKHKKQKKAVSVKTKRPTRQEDEGWSRRGTR